MNEEMIEYIKNSKTIITDRLKKKGFYAELIKMQQAANYENLIEFCYYLKTNEIGQCQYKDCINETKFISFKKGYNNGCCEDHTKRLNNLEKYGVENVMQSKEIKEKQQNTMIKKYGTTNALQNEDCLQKMIKTQINNGGVGAANEKIKSKMKLTNQIKYGVENVMQHKDIHEKFENTMKEKYGIIHALQNDTINKKRVETNIERFGATHHMLSKKYKDKLKLDFITQKLDKISLNVTPLFDISKYNNIEQQLKWKCNKCSDEFIDNLDNGKIPRCLNCFPLINKGFSNAEKDLVNELKKDFSIITNDRKILNGKELDIYIPDKKIAIEFNGIYWHSELQGKDKNYHLNKTQQCMENRIQLIHVFDTEWIEKRNIVLSIIRSKLSLFDTRIYARKTYVKEIDKNTKKDFLNNNHLQGNDKSSVIFGLFYNDELVSVMTFGKSRYNKNYQYEMHRFCNKLGHQIIGGASKLFQYFIKNYNPKSIITYADRRYSDGTFYEKIGFNQKWRSQPAPWYFKGSSPLSNRKSWQKHLLEKKLEIFNKDLTAWENMQVNGYNRVWDCGNYVFGWRID